MNLIDNSVNFGSQIFIPWDAPYLSHEDAVHNVIGWLEMPKVGGTPPRDR